jgi:xanthine dehydrogenase accessory factor
MDMAPLTVGLGPGFEAGRDVHYVIETMRGHDLGRIISEGSAAPNTGIPGMVGGYGRERVIRAPGAGIFCDGKEIGSLVRAGEVIGRIEVGGSGASAVEVIGREASGNGAEAVEMIGREVSGNGAEAVEMIGREVSGNRAGPVEMIGREAPGIGAGTIEVRTVLSGVLRGIIRDGYPVTEGFKLADVDPRSEEQKNCFTISDKARCIAGSVLELVCAYHLRHR